MPTWSTRRSGREPPRAAWAPSQGVQRQAMRPSLPAIARRDALPDNGHLDEPYAGRELVAATRMLVVYLL